MDSTSFYQWCVSLGGWRTVTIPEAKPRYSDNNPQWGKEWWEHFNYSCGLTDDDLMVLAQFESVDTFTDALEQVAGYYAWAVCGKKRTIKDGVVFYRTFKHLVKKKSLLWYC